jgi:CRISPR/Cas system-associated exonuclease Cas4 (RecB family)
MGASEYYACIRKTRFKKKKGVLPDPEYAGNLGYRTRGNLIERFSVTSIKSNLPAGAHLLLAGDDQKTLVSGRLSATPDGLILLADGTCFLIEIKSVDPRADIRSPKQAHVAQCQQQMGLVREKTIFKPDKAVLLYVNCSDLSTVEFDIEYDPRAMEIARSRAKMIFGPAADADLPAEGAYAGECKWCEFRNTCSATTVDALPKEKKALDTAGEMELEHLIESRQVAATSSDLAAKEKKIADSRIKDFLRKKDVRSTKAGAYTVSYVRANGRRSLDTTALAAEVDLAPYYKEGRPSDRLTITRSKQEK